jgi:hypothetical protein
VLLQGNIPVPQQIGEAEYGIQRRAQFVTHIGGKVCWRLASAASLAIWSSRVRFNNSAVRSATCASVSRPQLQNPHA